MKVFFKYLSYLSRHKWFVFLGGLKTDASLWRLLKHDWSKFLPSEFWPYALYFYAHGSKDDFQLAWLRHIHRNDHHWQHWVLRNDGGSQQTLDIPEHVIREMVADWMGAGRAITGKWETQDWYSKNKKNMSLHPATQAKVEYLLALVGLEKP